MFPASRYDKWISAWLRVVVYARMFRQLESRIVLRAGNNKKRHSVEWRFGLKSEWSTGLLFRRQVLGRLLRLRIRQQRRARLLRVQPLALLPLVRRVRLLVSGRGPL